ncbi:GTPase-activating protein and VPS9 domain-containing protein 1 [Trichinella spiralis]|uniref:GTPase-activating protein and VPS9 domain-containing protein 1 n=1 Tax=Trichinella spiralis TaxID=6334 RepID=A0A0V1ATN6_TRISP|nr:GTPase-activating protein and VPS9 domain-containing protein 1 [Trichinella spiralis]
MRYQNQLVDLCYRLRDEKLLVNADIDLILCLNTEVEEQILELVKICWIHCHQHRTLSKLLQSHPDATVQNACSQLCQLENAHFSDSKKQLANNETTVTEILRLLLNSSKLVATVLHFFECVEPNLADELCFTFFCSVYGSCQFVNDEKCLYAVLCDLMRLQFSHCEGENLRRMLRRGSGAFCKMYRLATGSLFSVSLFLASALYQPIMQLISQNEQLLEIDPTKAAMRFSATEKLANWGLEDLEIVMSNFFFFIRQPDFEDCLNWGGNWGFLIYWLSILMEIPKSSLQYKENIANYRKIIIQRLVLVSNNFIQSIRDSLHCFPVPLAWLLRQLHFFLSDCLKLTTSECDQICTELIFSYIICPAIANPEAFGILSDTPVSSVARFNLMQVGQILQALAVCPWDRLDSKLNDLYSQFDTNSVHMLYRAILSDTVSIPLHRSNLDDIYTMEVKLARRHAAFSTDELNQLLNALRQVVENSSAPAGLESCWQELKQLLNSLPTTILLPSMNNNNNNNNSTIVQQQQHRTPSKQLIDLTEAISSSTSRSTVQSSTTTRSRSCMKLTKPLATMSLMRSPSESNVQNIPLQQQQQSSSPPALFSSTATTTAASLLSAPTGYPDVFLFAISDPQEPVGLFGEEKFLSMMRQMKYGREESSCNAKRTRFMLAVDSDSLGANSDQLDEVASDEQRSDCSSAGQLTDHADMSALNDNFSDVDAVPMSANVSGRGSPSISGRDTPSSVPADQNDNAFEVSSQSPCGSGDMRQKTSCCSLPLPTMKANAMEERFGKFAMMPTRNRECHRDETHSMVSDSWSTDVLASDSEFGGDVQQSQLPLSSAWLPDIVPCPAPQAPRLDLISEKAQHMHTSASVGDHSDTWSVEASDSENDPNQRLRDIENDVFQSVSGVGENSRHILKSPVSDDGDSVSEQGLPCACQSTKPVHRQSSGSSLYSEIPDEGSSCGAGPSSSSLSSGAYLQHRPKQQQQRTWKTVPVQELSSSFRPYLNATSSNSNHKSCPVVADGNYPSVCFRAGGDKVDELDREEVSVVFHNESAAMPSGSSSSVVRTTPTAAVGFGNSSNNLRTNFATTVAKKLSPHVNRVIGLRGSSFSSPSIAATTASTATATTTTLTTNADLAAPSSSIAGREGLFRGFRGLKPLRGRTPARNVTSKLLAGNGESAAGSSSVQGESACDSAGGAPFASRDYTAETGDQILDKYRCMALRNDDEPGGPTTTTTTTPLEPLVQMDEDTARPYYDSNNLTECQAFVDLKRKLRLILSTVDVDTLPVVTFRLSQTCSSLQQVKEHDELKQFLRVQLAETLISERMSLCVQIEDALRTLSYFDSKGVRKLLKTMHEEHGRRSAYVNYVQQSKLSLLQSKMFIKKLLNRITREQKITIHSVVEFCVRFYLEQRFDSQIKAFVHEFQQLQLLDEKTHLLSTFLTHIYSSLQADSLWNGCTSDQLEWIRLSIERMITARIYVSALYPNGEVDAMRDKLFHQTVQRLGDLITPTHKSLAIPTGFREDKIVRNAEYIAECPWPSAQAEILKINVYKSAGDKVKCVRRCCETIMHLLRASNAQTPSADDMVPLVVYVLIKANPEALLSTIQYVNGFYSGRMEGEEAYCWTQFFGESDIVSLFVFGAHVGKSLNEMRKMAAEEDEPGIPRAALNRVIRETLPNARMSNDFRDVLHLCCMQFIKHVGAEANRLCMNDQKKTINKDHLFRAVQNLGFGPDYLDAGRSVLDLCDEEASRRLKRQNSRLEKCGIPEEELLKLQQQLFDKVPYLISSQEQCLFVCLWLLVFQARTEQASANQLQTAWFQQQWQESMRQKQLMPPPPLPPPVKPSLAAAAVAAAAVSSSPPPPPPPSLPHAASPLPSSSSSSPSSSVLVTSTYSSSQSTFAPLNSNSTLTTSAYSSSTSAPTISASAVLQSVSKMNHKIWEMQNNNDADDDYDAA